MQELLTVEEPRLFIRMALDATANGYPEALRRRINAVLTLAVVDVEYVVSLLRRLETRRGAKIRAACKRAVGMLSLVEVQLNHLVFAPDSMFTCS